MTTPYGAMIFQGRQAQAQQIFAGTYKDCLKKKTKLKLFNISWMWPISILPGA